MPKFVMIFIYDKAIDTMRKHFTALVMFLLYVLLTGCSADTKQYRIGVSQCSQDDWRQKMNDEINRELMFHPDVMVEIRSADDSNEKQLADLRYFVDNNFDIIIVAPNEADAITPAVKAIYESGTPVIVFDRNINGDSYTAFQGADNAVIGRAAADYARYLTGDSGHVLEIYGLKGSTPADGRHEGFASRLRESGSPIRSDIAYGDWNYEDASRVADSVFALHPDINLVYAHNDRMAIAAADVARKRGVDPYIIGVDAAPEIGIRAVADSVIDATFLYPTEGHRLVRTALAILKGEPYDRVTLLDVPSPVDLSNADLLLMQNDQLREETTKLKELKSQVDDFWQRHSAQTSLMYAAVVILVLLCGVIFLLLRTFWTHKRHQAELVAQNRELEEQRDLQRQLNRQLEEATQSKLMFFTNVSHDLRTPLTLIAEPVEQLVGAANLTPAQQTFVKIADKNVRILHRLINQILDFRKYESGKLDLHRQEVDFASLVPEWADSFRAMARRRDIKFEITIDSTHDLVMGIDVEKMERVFFNLMSNAFKHTPDNGRISFVCTRDGDTVTFTVADSGEGIPKEHIEQIFKQFYQVEKHHPDGSGIGLSLVKAFVELHGGSITADSEPGHGAVFTVKIPVVHVSDTVAAHQPAISPGDVMAELAAIEPESGDGDDDKPLLLVIDDNDDLRKLLGELLHDEYRVLAASNGQDGLRMAARHVPDIIICDVMMPVMDGLECCRLIKDEISTSHIPVLMLTACSMDEQRAQGYDSGADGYLAKPFNADVLRSRCRSLIANRRRIRQLWASDGLPSASAGMNVDNPKAARGDMENEFYSRFIDIVNAEMGDPDLNVDSLASKMGLGRSQFYRKIKALTNYSPVELLRRMRLNRARDLLTTTDRTISEIGYEVGFASPAYFTRCYREAFGETPSDLRDRLSGR